MKIAFACPTCGKQLSVDATLAGRTGRCKNCGTGLVVPSSGQATGPLALSTAKPPAGKTPAADWRSAVVSQLKPPSGRAAATAVRPAATPATTADGGYSLRPITPTAVPALAEPDWGDSELGDAIDSPSAIFSAAAKQPRSSQTTLSTPSKSMSALAAYRLFFSLLSRVTTWISQASYTLSFVLIILALASGMAGNHTVAAWATIAIIVLNLIGISGDIASLLTLSYQKNPIRGTLFLVPPFTLYYLWTDWYRYRGTVRRMRTPLVTLAVVVAAYLFVPWLRGGIEGEGLLAGLVTRTVGTIEKDLGRPQGTLDEGLKKARAWLHDVPLPDPSSLPGFSGSKKPLPDRAP